MDILCKNLINYIGGKLPDKDLLSLSRVNKRFNKVIRSSFREYFVIMKYPYKLILIIEKSHPKYEQILSSKIHSDEYEYVYDRFMVSNAIRSVWIGKLDYFLSHRKKSKKRIDEGNIKYKSPHKNIIQNYIMSDIQTKVLDVLELNNVLLFDQEDGNNNPKNRVEIVNNAANDLSNNLKNSWDINACDTYFRSYMIQLDTTDAINIATKGYWKILQGRTKSKKIIKKLCKGNKKYITHDNGCRPFIVIHKKKNNHVNVYSNEEGYLIAKYKHASRVFPGIGRTEYYSFEYGSSVLVNIEGNKYVYIGDSIYEFDTPDNDVIIEYYSLVSNNDVPYPVAVSDNYVYFMLDHVHIKKTEFINYNNWMDAYSYFYGHIGPTGKRMIGDKFPNFVQVHFGE